MDLQQFQASQIHPKNQKPPQENQKLNIDIWDQIGIPNNQGRRDSLMKPSTEIQTNRQSDEFYQ